MTLGCRTLITVALATACLGALTARVQTIRIAAPTEIGRETDPRRFVEPHLAVDPNDPDHLLVGVFVSWEQGARDEMQANQRCAAFVSRDKGQSWSRHDFPLVDCVDPQVALFPNGQAIFVALGRMPGIQPRTNTWLVIYHSPDGGGTWESEPTLIGRGHDHPALVVDQRSPARKGWVYITTTRAWRDGNGDEVSGVFIVRSRDGKSFDEPIVVSPNGLINGAEMPAILSDGTLIASFVDESRSPPSFERRRAWIVRSENGASSFSTPFLVSNDVCGPPPVFQLSALVADASDGPSRDRLYFACRQSGGGPVVVVSSKDRGKTWNRPGVPVGPTAIDVNARRVMTLGVNNAGVVGAFIAERRAKYGEACQQFLFAASFDGGQSFGALEPVSRSECLESTAEETAQRRHPTYGDYFGMTSLPDGTFRVIWPQMRDGRSVLLTTTITSNGNVK